LSVNSQNEISKMKYTLKLGMKFINRNKEDVFENQLLLDLTEVLIYTTILSVNSQNEISKMKYTLKLGMRGFL